MPSIYNIFSKHLNKRPYSIYITKYLKNLIFGDQNSEPDPDNDSVNSDPPTLISIVFVTLVKTIFDPCLSMLCLKDRNEKIT